MENLNQLIALFGLDATTTGILIVTLFALMEFLKDQFGDQIKGNTAKIVAIVSAAVISALVYRPWETQNWITLVASTLIVWIGAAGGKRVIRSLRPSNGGNK